MRKAFEVVHNIPSPYRLHLFNVMWKQLKARGYDFHVNFMAEGHKERPDSWRRPEIMFPHTYWRDYGHGAHHFNPGMIMDLRLRNPDVLLVGSTFDTYTSIFLTYLCTSKVRCAWSEGNTKTTGRMNGFLGWFKREILSHYKYVGVAGSDSAAYISMHQARTKKIMPQPIYLPNLVDESRFSVNKNLSGEEKNRIRRMMGVREGERCCFIPARFVWEKGLLEFAGLLTPDMLSGWKIVIIGDGPLHHEFESLIRDRGIDRYFSILPVVAYEDMPLYYAVSDLFLLPSIVDRNPLSVIEALHSKLPIALSNQAGNVGEAVSHGDNGWILPIESSEGMKAVLSDVFSTSKEDLARMGIRSSFFARFWDSETAVEAFLDGIVGHI